MKTGDIVRWKSPTCSLPGIVLKTQPTKPLAGNTPKTAVLAYLPELPEPEWFHEIELEVLFESNQMD